MAEFRSNRPTDVARLDSLRFEIVPVLVPRLVGEVGLPGRSTTLAQLPLGEPAELVYAINARFAGGGNDGFDAVHIRTPSTPEFIGLRVGDPPVETVPVGHEADPGGLTVFLPNPVRTDEALLINFSTTRYSVSESLEGAVFQSDYRALRQLIDEGDADGAILTNKLKIVAADDIRSSIGDLSVQPIAFTPNGDGSNDETRITYTLFGVQDVEVEVAIYNLSGRVMRRLVVVEPGSGLSNPIFWDGRDRSGGLVPPGLYLCQVETNTSRGRDRLMSAIALAY